MVKVFMAKLFNEKQFEARVKLSLKKVLHSDVIRIILDYCNPVNELRFKCVMKELVELKIAMYAGIGFGPTGMGDNIRFLNTLVKQYNESAALMPLAVKFSDWADSRISSIVNPERHSVTSNKFCNLEKRLICAEHSEGCLRAGCETLRRHCDNLNSAKSINIKQTQYSTTRDEPDIDYYSLRKRS